MLHRETRSSFLRRVKGRNIESIFHHPMQSLKICHDGLGQLCTLHMQATPHRTFQDYIDERSGKCSFTVLKNFKMINQLEAELEEVSGR